MLRLIFSFTVLFSFYSLAGQHHVPSHEDEHGPDLPSVGSSLFDKIFSKQNIQGEVVYNVPYPIDKLVSVLGEKNELVHTILPFSRSLQRPQNLSYDPILNPRVIFTPRNGSHLMTPARLFLGFVKAKDQIEVISYNEEAGRFEYQLITDYSKDPKVYYVNRGKCLSCHQNQAPIFSPAPWADTSFGVGMGKVLDKKLETKNLTRDQFVRGIFGKNKTQEKLFIFDDLVRKADGLNFDERIWVHGCGSDNRCRLGLLFNTLCRSCSGANQHIFYASNIIKQSLFKQQIKYSSFLTSFDINAVKTIMNYGTVEDAVKDPNFSLDMINNLYNLSGANNPGEKRPSSIDVSNTTFPFRSFSNEDIRTLRNELPANQNLGDILNKLYNENHSIFEQDSLNRTEIMTTLLEQMGSPKAEAYKKWLNVKTPQKNLFDGIIQPIFQKTELNTFSRYCHQCHASGLQFPPQFLLGTEQEVSQKINDLRKRIIFKLEYNLMPPNDKERELLKSSGDYDRLMKYLEQ